MLKKIFIAIMCIAVLLSIVACSKDDAHQNEGTTNQAESSLATDASQPGKPTEGPSKPTEDISTPTEEKESVFNTEDIIRITFYAYYGNGKGSDVPAEHLNKIITWLDSFEVDTNKEFPELVPPGTNTVHVEIEYLDGGIIKQGMDTTVVDGVTYYIKGATRPECYDEIISKTSLS